MDDTNIRLALFLMKLNGSIKNKAFCVCSYISLSLYVHLQYHMYCTCMVAFTRIICHCICAHYSLASVKEMSLCATLHIFDGFLKSTLILQFWNGLNPISDTLYHHDDSVLYIVLTEDV